MSHDSRLKVAFFNLGGGPAPSGRGFVFTEGGLVHAVYSFVPLAASHDVTVICPNVLSGSDGHTYDFRGVRITCPPGVRLAPFLRPGELSFTERRLATSLLWPAAVAAYRRTLKDARRMDPDVVLANGIVGSYLLSRHRREAPVIAVVHHLYHDARTSGSVASASGLTAHLEMMLLRRLSVDGVAVVNPAVQQRLVECGMDAERVVCVGNGVDAGHYAFAETKPGLQLTFVGRLRRLKCVDRVIDAFALVHAKRPEAVLNIIGDGPMRHALEQQAASLGLGNSVVFHGFLPEEAKVAILRATTVYLSASAFEGFGIPVVEAMATGAVPVVNSIPSHAFIFQGCEVGFLVDSPDEMAERALHVLENESLRGQMARKGRDLVVGTWTWGAVAQRYRALIDRVLADRR